MRAVITVTTDESAYAKKCKHFLMLIINYVREQVDLGIIKVLKIPGQNNMSDVLTKSNFNKKDLETKTDGILGKRHLDR